ncbi:ankyrin repeat protein, putative [Bodo saltans]|uniref:Ankyrin repeat protein, putative n=1 Tax=Bodo saltans TaxID=75058 RepID=A0A0S4KHT8_BODSA|nr:ankyrin repeat protein, putative [Bodo saltans]|eukprot:CUI14522.1 ankyrin repeat protein, putative [Bodo saltans]
MASSLREEKNVILCDIFAFARKRTKSTSHFMTEAAVSQHLSELCRSGSIEAIIRKVALECDDQSVAINWQDADGRTAFHWAIGLRCWDVAKALMGEPHRCDVCTIDKDGCSPLMSACAVDAPDEIILALLERCSRTANAESASLLDTTDSSGNTAFMLAASKGNVSAIRKLAHAGCDVFAQNRRGQTALHRSVSRGQMDAVEELILVCKTLDRKIRIKFINTQDVEGNTALHYASLENNQELGQYLLRNGADREVRNKQGKTFYEL